MSSQSAIALGLLLCAASIGYSVWMQHEARDIAETWLMQNRFRVHSLKVGWFSFMRFRPQWFRNNDRAHEFRAVVTDMSLGGTGVMWLRVWTDRAGLIMREPEISWERMPERAPGAGASDRPLDDQWRSAQHALLARIAAGETSFVTSRGDAAAAAFDEQVEHLLAMQKRGLITCDAPLPSRAPGALYDAISNVQLTDTGRSYLKITAVRCLTHANCKFNSSNAKAQSGTAKPTQRNQRTLCAWLRRPAYAR